MKRLVIISAVALLCAGGFFVAALHGYFNLAMLALILGTASAGGIAWVLDDGPLIRPYEKERKR